MDSAFLLGPMVTWTFPITYLLLSSLFLCLGQHLLKKQYTNIIHKKQDFPLVQLYPSQNTFRTQLNEAMLLYPHHHKGKDESEFCLAKPILLKWF